MSKSQRWRNRKLRRRWRNGGVRHRLTAGRTGSVAAKRRKEKSR